MPLVRNGKIVEDAFTRVGDEAALPAGVPVIVSPERFFADADGLTKRNSPVGVAWPNDRDIAELEPYLPKLALIVLTFPNFRDGRAYSQARLLRERYGFEGELRATGQVLRDQFLFMVRAGFDAFEVLKSRDAQAFEGTLQRYSAFYQPAGDQPSGKRGRLALVPAVTRAKSTV